MDVAVLFFLSSGLFLGWSLGANDAANVFGTAVGTRMVRFATATLICSVFVRGLIREILRLIDKLRLRSPARC